jgi:hypothetical protein
MTKRPDFEGYKIRLRKFKQYKDTPEEEFSKIASELYNKKYGTDIEKKLLDTSKCITIKNEVGIWVSKEEAQEAKKLFDIYVKSRSIEDPSDVALLKNLIFYEMQLQRIYNAVNDEYTRKLKEKEMYDVPSQELKTINEINERIIEIKKVLGLAQEQKGDDPLLYINQFKKKCLKWAREQYQASRFRICPHCSKPIMFYMRPDVWEACKHPWFKDKVLANDWLWECYKLGKLTKEDMSKILLGKECKSILYIDWLEKKIYNVQENIDPLKESGDIKESGQD